MYTVSTMIDDIPELEIVFWRTREKSIDFLLSFLEPSFGILLHQVTICLYLRYLVVKFTSIVNIGHFTKKTVAKRNCENPFVTGTETLHENYLE